MMSTITGGVPMRRKLSGSAKSFALKPSIGAPNLASAAYTPNQNVQIFGSTRLGMKRNRVSADNQVSNLSGVEG
jgi:hypothetical protein